MKKIQWLIQFLMLFIMIAGPAMADGNRHFYMGFTPLPYDFTQDGFQKTYDLINQHGDIVSHHLDEGVPWEEALDNKPFDKNVEEDLKRRLDLTAKDKKIFLSVTPLALNRVDLAGSWGADSHTPRKGRFKSVSMNHPNVVKAYTSYCLRLIDRFDPAFFAYAIEVSELSKFPEQRKQFVDLARQVYTTVKEKYPSLYVFPTFVLGDQKALDQSADFVRELMPYSDILAVSTYPYVWDEVGGDAERLPSDWFDKLDKLSQGKPLAVSETGFLADDFRYVSKLVWIPSNEKAQYKYMQKLLKNAQEKKMAFVIWYVPVDYDLLWKKMKDGGVDFWFAQWMRTGLWNKEMTPRKALKSWAQWLGYKKLSLENSNE